MIRDLLEVLFLEAEARRLDPKTNAIETALRNAAVTAQEDAVFASELQPGGTLYEQIMRWQDAKAREDIPTKIVGVRTRQRQE